jgi:hypothetical protein
LGLVPISLFRQSIKYSSFFLIKNEKNLYFSAFSAHRGIVYLPGTGLRRISSASFLQNQGVLGSAFLFTGAGKFEIAFFCLWRRSHIDPVMMQAACFAGFFQEAV